MTSSKLRVAHSLPNTMMKSKFMDITDDWYDPDTVFNSQKETLRFTGCDKPLFEHELSRKENPIRDTIIRMHQKGSYRDHDPYQPELFLGDLTKDVRGVENNPNVNQIADHARFRQERYIKGKLQDSPDTKYEGPASSKRIDNAVRGGFDNTASRMAGIFNDSSDVVVRKSSANPGRTIQKVGDNLKEDQQIYQTKSETIIPQMGYNPVTIFSNQIGAQWKAQPESKFGLSSISNTYRSKGAVDAAVNAVFRMGLKDTKVKESLKNVSVAQAILITKDSIKRDKQNQTTVEVQLNKDSQQNEFINRIVNPKRLNAINSSGGKAIDRFEYGQKVGMQQITFNNRLKAHDGNKQKRLGEIEQKKLTNSENIHSNNASLIPVKDRMKIFKEIKRDSKRSRNEKFTTRYALNMKARKMNKRKETAREISKMNHNNETTNALYKQAKLSRPEDRVTNTKLQQTKNRQEQMTNANAVGQVMKNTTTIMSNFEYDTDIATNNDYMTRRGGSSKQRGGYVFGERDPDNELSPLTDLIGTTRYIKKSKQVGDI